MQLRFAILLLLACFFANNLSAQRDKKKPNRDVEIIDFGDTDNNSQKETVYHGLILKTSPVSFIFGRQPIELEKEMNDFLSLQAGAGVTFEPLWSAYDELLNEINDEFNGSTESELWASDEPDNYADYSIRTGKIGLQFSVSPRLFFDSDGYEGMYIAPVFRYSTQKFEVQKVREGVPYLERNPDDLQQESIKNMDLMVHYGGQTLYPKLTLEWFIGAGIRFSDNRRQDVGYDFLFLAGNGERSFKDKKFRLETGIRVGFQL
ncbi:MAG: hypothetical protein IT262_03020 [Saprospiraceae bacterium]|nr:hypothetical protein [Saprospiraceae bacterium]